MTELVLLGSGNVATHLYRAFSASKNLQVVQVYNHTPRGLRTFEDKVPITSNLKNLFEADIYLLALKDDAIAGMAAQLVDRKGLVAHTSGAVALDAISGTRAGVFYPLQTFSSQTELCYGDIPFCLESRKKKDLDLLKYLAKEVSDKFYEVSSEQRKKLHLSAVFVCNFVNHLYSIGEDICKENGLPFEILQPLIQETARKILSASPSKVQTGPAIRQDQDTITSHLALIEKEQEKEIYNLLTRAIQSFHGKKL